MVLALSIYGTERNSVKYLNTLRIDIPITGMVSLEKHLDKANRMAEREWMCIVLVDCTSHYIDRSSVKDPRTLGKSQSTNERICMLAHLHLMSADPAASWRRPTAEQSRDPAHEGRLGGLAGE